MDYLDEVNITVLAEDTAGYDTSLTARFGLSMLLEARVEKNRTQFLYDTNQAAAPILENLKTLRLSIEELNSIFLSHCHFDHTGGLPGILDALHRPIPVLGHPSLFRPCFEMKPEGLWPIGLLGYSRDDLERKKASFILTQEPVRLMSGMITTGEIPRINDFELAGEMFTVADGKIVKDDLKDDAAVVLLLRAGLVILVGCCHAGIVNTIARAKEITGVAKVHAVVGGLHLLDADDNRLERTMGALDEVDLVFAGHCTGLKAAAMLLRRRGTGFSPIFTGRSIHFPLG